MQILHVCITSFTLHLKCTLPHYVIELDGAIQEFLTLSKLLKPNRLIEALGAVTEAQLLSHFLHLFHASLRGCLSLA